MQRLAEIIIKDHIAIQLIAKAEPAAPNVVRPGKYFNFARARCDSFNHSIDLIRLAACFSDLGNNDVAINVAIDVWIALDANEAVLLGMIDPVTRAACSDDALQLIGLHPHNLVYPLVPPDSQAFTSCLHCTTSHPQENQAIVLKSLQGHRSHLLIRKGAVRQLHVNVPWWVRHNGTKLAKMLKWKLAYIAIDPLSGRQILGEGRIGRGRGIAVVGLRRGAEVIFRGCGVGGGGRARGSIMVRPMWQVQREGMGMGMGQERRWWER
mmetsp:Transcript_38175/g.61807  ORF Transcript_38175/g.61807 Transcript_38175/m.61807 type:complete len:266 (+) Transcript_38175:703-1500(+)